MLKIKKYVLGAKGTGSFWHWCQKDPVPLAPNFNGSGTFIFLRHIMGYRKMEVLYVFRHFFYRTFRVFKISNFGCSDILQEVIYFLNH